MPRRPRAADSAQPVAGQLPALLDAARAVNSASGLQETLERILDRAIDLVGADQGSVMLLDHRAGVLRVTAARGLNDEIVASTAVALGEGISGYVASTGQALLLDRSTSLDRYPDDHRRGLHSAVCAPLRVEGELLGVLNVNVTADDGDDLDAQDLEVVRLFAEFAATAVRNARSVQDTSSHARVLARLLEAGHALAGVDAPGDVATRILQAAQDLLGVSGGLVLRQDAGGRLEVLASKEVPRGLVLAALRRESSESLAACTELRVVEELAGHPVLGPIGRWAPTGIVAPLLLGAGERCTVVLTTDHLPAATAIDTWGTFAQHAAAVMARAMLLEDLRGKEEELTTLTGAIPDPIVVVDAEERILALNPAAAEVLGLNTSFDVGRPIESRLPHPALLEALREGGATPREVTLHLPDAQTFRVRSVPVRARDGAGEGGRIMSLEDITAARDMERIKADFVAVIGHELRTPMTLIKGYGETLSKRGEALGPDGRAKAMEALRGQAAKLERLIEDLLLVSRVERDRPPLHIDQEDLGVVVQEAAAAGIDAHGSHTFALDVPDAPLRCDVDRVKIEQVLRHLIDNACKFSDPGSEVRIRVTADATSITVSVSDDGVGIFSGDLPNLFERFRQIDGSGTRSHGGTGVGLHICRTLVEAHGGSLRVDSALGRGSTFAFELPRVQRRAEESRLADQASA